jgi:hypothetical protein
VRRGCSCRGRGSRPRSPARRRPSTSSHRVRNTGFHGTGCETPMLGHRIRNANTRRTGYGTPGINSTGVRYTRKCYSIGCETPQVIVQRKTSFRGPSLYTAPRSSAVLRIGSDICTQHLVAPMCAGDRNRTVGTTNCNAHSSRSHAVLTFHIESRRVGRCCWVPGALDVGGGVGWGQKTLSMPEPPSRAAFVLSP